MPAMESSGSAAHDLAAEAAARERAGEWPASGELYARAFEAACAEGDAEAMADAARRQGWVRCRQQQYEEAEELLELSREIAERQGLERAAAGAVNAIATYALSVGELDRASALYHLAMERARGIADDELIGSICQNLGVIANIHGDLVEARALYLESIGAAVRAGNRPGAMMAYNNLGMAYTDQSEWMEAEIYFTRGIEIARQIGDRGMEAKLHVNRVEPLVHVGEFAQAREVLRRAEEVATRTDDVRALADIDRFRALIARYEGEYAGAEAHLEAALGRAEGAGLLLEQGEVLEETARLRWAQGRPGPARMVLREARRLYASLGAAHDLARVDRLGGEWAAAREESGGVPAG